MTRKTIRQTLVTLFDADSAFNQVLGYLPLDLNGATKVLCVYAQGTEPEFISGTTNNDFHHYYLSTFVKRTGAVADEDSQDDMQEAIRNILRANVSNGDNWDHLEPEKSTVFPLEISGVPYLIERHPLKVKLPRSS